MHKGKRHKNDRTKAEAVAFMREHARRLREKSRTMKAPSASKHRHDDILARAEGWEEAAKMLEDTVIISQEQADAWDNPT